jgi:UPF0755 protein
MSQGRRSTRFQSSSRRRKRTSDSLLIKTGLLGTVVVLLVVAGLLLVRNLSRRGEPIPIGVDFRVDSSLNPVEAAVLSAYLASNQEALITPISLEEEEVIFEIVAGATGSDVADALVVAGLIADPALFRNYLHYYGLDRQLEAGTHRLSPTMTIPDIAVALTSADPPDITVRIPEGWRREQIADWIDMNPEIPFSGAEFLAMTGSGATFPDGLILAGDLPSGKTLEGFLFPDTYRLSLDASAQNLVDRMLETLDSQITSDMRTDASARGLSIYEVITLASIVEREAAVEEERPRIAGVYLNRLFGGMKLDADPTVQYAQGFHASSGEWWNRNLTQADYQDVISPYNTYLNEGLPPGPIANPSIASIRAVIYAEDIPYVFFRAACDGSGLHNFAENYEQHLANACP